MKEKESAGLPQRAIDSSNKGNRMLQKMGWKEGTGLGKTNQGRTNIIEVMRKSSLALVRTFPLIPRPFDKSFRG